VLKREIEEKLKKKIDESTYEDYESIAKKLENIEVVSTIDKDILEKFNKKKVVMEEYDKNIDKITQDKRKIESRRKETYNRRKYS
jgi:ribosomal protein L14E/L6E/L27E